MSYRIKSAEPLCYPVLRITFEDGFSGVCDLTDLVESGTALEPLRDKDRFREVAVAPDGSSFGWNLDQLGHEIDFCPDATRIALETQKVEELASRFRARRSAAE